MWVYAQATLRTHKASCDYGSLLSDAVSGLFSPSACAVVYDGAYHLFIYLSLTEGQLPW